MRVRKIGPTSYNMLPVVVSGVMTGVTSVGLVWGLTLMGTSHPAQASTVNTDKICKTVSSDSQDGKSGEKHCKEVPSGGTNANRDDKDTHVGTGKLPNTPSPNGATVNDPEGNNSTGRPQIYQIVPGDTLSSISGQTGVSVDELANFNQIHNPNLIYAGSSLQVPDKVCLAPGAQVQQITPQGQ